MSKKKEKAKEQKDHPMYAIISLIFGIMSMVMWLFPAVGFPTSAIGLGLGLAGKKSSKRELAKKAVFVCIVGMVLALANAAYGAYLGYTGQLVLPK
jgi:hypothetical protein